VKEIVSDFVTVGEGELVKEMSYVADVLAVASRVIVDVTDCDLVKLKLRVWVSVSEKLRELVISEVSVNVSEKESVTVSEYVWVADSCCVIDSEYDAVGESVKLVDDDSDGVRLKVSDLEREISLVNDKLFDIVGVGVSDGDKLLDLEISDESDGVDVGFDVNDIDVEKVLLKSYVTVKVTDSESLKEIVSVGVIDFVWVTSAEIERVGDSVSCGVNEKDILKVSVMVAVIEFVREMSWENDTVYDRVVDFVSEISFDIDRDDVDDIS
jgi:hypothetical protein